MGLETRNIKKKKKTLGVILNQKTKLSWSKLYQPLFQIFVIFQRQASGESNAQPPGKQAGLITLMEK